jgi:hypothetical protein
MNVLFSELVCFKSSETCLTALTSNQESISSNMITLGLRSFICRTSIFLFSPQLNPTFKSLRKNSLSIQRSSMRGSIIFLKPMNEVGFSCLTS